jgi:ankyrin repeat protein
VTHLAQIGGTVLAMPEVTDFFAAISGGDVATVRALLDEDPRLLDASSADGASASLTALYHGHPPLADELAARTGELTVFEAAAFDDIGRLAELIERDRAIVESWSADGWQPLHLAAFFGRAEAVRTLLDADAPVAEPSRNEMTVQPLHAAAAGQHSEIVWLLIASDAPVQVPQRHGWTPLHSAVHNGDVESIKALLAAGADPRTANDDGSSALDLAPNDSIRTMLTEVS